MCKEMLELRKILSERKIEFSDKSYTVGKNFWIHRTMFMIAGHYFLVMNGRGTIGGFLEQEKFNQGYLELVIDGEDGVGMLSAEEVMRRVDECICHD